MRLAEWVSANGGIVHRDVAGGAGYGTTTVRSAAADGVVRIVRSRWIAVSGAPDDLVAAASAGARLACVSLARRRGWWLPPEAPTDLHLHVPPKASRYGVPTDGTLHWSVPIAPPARHALTESVEDALRHLALCLPHEQALVAWESAIRREKLDVDALRRVRWRSTAAAACAAQVRGLSDSGLETLFVTRLSHWGVPIRQQVVLAGHRVDILIGHRLVVQIDGFEHHRTAAQRSRDVALDAELHLRGYTVLRFTYAQVIYDWPAVERTIARAVAAGLHLT